MIIRNLSRRRFLQSLVGAGALVLGLPVVGGRVARADEDDAELSPNLFLAITVQGTVRIVAHRSEMGTGIRTCLPAVVADELEANWDRIEIVQAPGDPRYGSQNTDGSRSVRNFFTTMRHTGAAARLMLERAAAQRWEVPAEECRAFRHHVVHQPTGKKLPFEGLVAIASGLPVPALEDLRLKPRESWRYIGTSFASYDLEDTVRGKASFGIDATLPGMLHAVVARPRVHGAKLRSFDGDAARAVKGVVDLVELPAFTPPHAFQALGGVAVVARNTWAAMQGRKKLALQWDEGALADFDSDAYLAELAATSQQPCRLVSERGDVATALAEAEEVVSATYTTAFLAHAPMEPPCALARFSDGRCEVWAPTQNPQAAQDTLCAVLGLPADRVTVYVTLLGGGFGRKSKPDALVEAALIAREVGAPVKVTWSREDDIRADYYHAASAQTIDGVVEGERLFAWRQRSVFPTIASTFAVGANQGQPFELMMGLTDLPWAVPHLRVENGEAAAPVRIGWLRAVCNLFHVFATGSFIDELAHAAGMDSRRFQIYNLGPDRILELGEGYPNYGASYEDYPADTARLRRVIERVTESAGWGRELPAGHGLGLAAHRSFLSYVAVVAEVAVEGKLVRIPRVDIAIDCGTIINPDRVIAQMEGSAVFGASLALTGEITLKNGRVRQGNFDDYPVARMHEAPREVRVVLIDSDAPPGGVGEPGVPPVAPAIANALFAATGKRVRSLPLLKSPDWTG